MKAINRIIEQAKTAPTRIVLCEAEDPRVLYAACRAQQHNIATIILVGNAERITQTAMNEDIDVDDMILIDPSHCHYHDEFAAALFELRKHKGMTLEAAKQAVLEPLCFANVMVRLGYADGSVAGAVHTTGDVVRNAIQIIGLAPSCQLVSSFFLMMLCQPFHHLKGGLIFSDCGLVVEPNEQELAHIAVAAANSARVLLMEEPKVAMLSFSTNGSAKHSAVDKVVAASQLVKQNAPYLAVDNDIQLDAALVADIANSKLPGSKVQGGIQCTDFSEFRGRKYWL